MDSQDAIYHSDVSSLQRDGPPKVSTSGRISHQDMAKNYETPPAAAAAADTSQTTSSLTSSPARTSSTTSGKSITDSVTPIASTSDVYAATGMSSVSSAASVSSHGDSEVQGTDLRSTPTSPATSTTATTDRSATHSYPTINVLLESSTTTQSGMLYTYIRATIFIVGDVNSPTH